MGNSSDTSHRSLLDHEVFAFDDETTGLDTAEDRIVQIGAVRFRAGVRLGQRRSSLVNPGVPIPPDATAVHGISDEVVATAPSFAEVGPRFVAQLLFAEDGSEPILCGYNAPGFDVPMINAELLRHGIAHRIDPTRVLDPLVFVRWHHRDWRARKLEFVAQQCGISLEGAHSAAADAEATGRVLWHLVAQKTVPEDYEDALATQRRLEALLEEEWSRFGRALYLDREDHTPRLGFGAHVGKKIAEVDRDYLRWCLGKMDDLTDEARALFQQAAKA
ncbi:MAG: 3'-5' exonuclease [Myxococcota bacterium]|nr:3'-5' exonuclease [Myxococcota bacterium]